MKRGVSLTLDAVVVAVALSCTQDAMAAPQAPRATLYVRGGDSEPELLAAVEKRLAADHRIRFTRLSELMKPHRRGPTPRETLAAARQMLGEAKRHIAALELDEAEATLRRAVAKLESRQHDIPLDQWANAYLRAVGDLAFCLVLAGKPEPAKLMLMRGFVVDQSMDYDASRYPPRMKRVFDEARFLFDAMGSGRADLDSGPPGAAVRVNGKAVGMTPLTVDLPAVRNLITFGKLGYESQTAPLKVQGGSATAKLSLQLSPLPGLPAADFDRATAEAALGKPGPALRNLARRLGCDVVVVGPLAADEGAISLKLHVYDARTGRIASTAGATVSSPADEELSGVVASLVASLARPPVVRRTKPWWHRMVRWKYFWPTVLVGAAVVATTVGIAATAPSGSSRARQVLVLPAVTPAW